MHAQTHRRESLGGAKERSSARGKDGDKGQRGEDRDGERKEDGRRNGGGSW